MSGPGATLNESNIYSNKGVLWAFVVGPRVIEAGASLLSVLVSPVPVAAGFPSPAQDYFDGRIDLNEHLIKDITSTYVVRVCGESMEGAGISDGDELIVNRALEPVDGSVVVAVLDGELTIKRLRITPSGWFCKRRIQRSRTSASRPCRTWLFGVWPPDAFITSRAGPCLSRL